MRAGTLNRRVQLQRPVTDVDAEGRTGDVWTAVATVWATVEPLQGREALLAAQAQTTLTHRVRIRYRTGVTARMRLVYGARIFDIQSVIDTGEARRELVLDCQELELEE
jgi:SPP1 family predicted phage head-tail adaptor